MQRTKFNYEWIKFKVYIFCCQDQDTEVLKWIMIQVHRQDIKCETDEQSPFKKVKVQSSQWNNYTIIFIAQNVERTQKWRHIICVSEKLFRPVALERILPKFHDVIAIIVHDLTEPKKLKKIANM